MSRLSPKSFAVNAVIMGVTILAMSGACSQHDPGPFEGGGRTTTTPQAPSGTDDGGTVQDTFVPPDNSAPPDTGGNQG